MSFWLCACLNPIGCCLGIRCDPGAGANEAIRPPPGPALPVSKRPQTRARHPPPLPAVAVPPRPLPPPSERPRPSNHARGKAAAWRSKRAPRWLFLASRRPNASVARYLAAVPPRPLPARPAPRASPAACCCSACGPDRAAPRPAPVGAHGALPPLSTRLPPFAPISQAGCCSRRPALHGKPAYAEPPARRPTQSWPKQRLSVGVQRGGVGVAAANRGGGAIQRRRVQAPLPRKKTIQEQNSTTSVDTAALSRATDEMEANKKGQRDFGQRNQTGPPPCLVWECGLGLFVTNRARKRKDRTRRVGFGKRRRRSLLRTNKGQLITRDLGA